MWAFGVLSAKTKELEQWLRMFVVVYWISGRAMYYLMLSIEDTLQELSCRIGLEVEPYTM